MRWTTALRAAGLYTACDHPGAADNAEIEPELVTAREGVDDGVELESSALDGIGPDGSRTDGEPTDAIVLRNHQRTNPC